MPCGHVGKEAYHTDPAARGSRKVAVRRVTIPGATSGNCSQRSIRLVILA